MIRITRSTYAPYGDDQKGEGETLMISAEVERNKIQYKPVYTRIFFLSQLEIWYTEISIKPMVVGVLVYWNEF